MIHFGKALCLEKGHKENGTLKKSFWIICFMVCIMGGCFWLFKMKDNQQLNRVERTLMILLNAPDRSFIEMYGDLFNQAASEKTTDSGNLSTLTELDDTEARRILTDRLKDDVTEEFISRCLAMDSVMVFQFMEATDGISTKVQNLSLVKTKQNNQFSFDAVIRIFKEGETTQDLNIYGQVQLDHSGQIDAIVLNGRDLDQFYRSLLPTG